MTSPSYTTFVALDLETTGLDAQTNKIIEVGAVRYVNGKYDDRYYAMVNPECEIPLFITKLTGITQSQVRDKDTIDMVLPHLKQFVRDEPLVIHNAGFDLAFLQANNYTPHNPAIDTLALARLLLPQLPNHKQTTLANHFQIDVLHAHRAYDDAGALAEIYLKLLQLLEQLDRKKLEQVLGFVNESKDGLRQLIIEMHRNAIQKPVSEKEGLSYLQFPSNQFGEHVSLKTDEEKQDITELDPTEIARIFQYDGSFAQKFPHYEVRQPQIKMTRAVAEAFNEGTLSMIEAGTGTGKSMAYLVPAVLWAVQNNQRVIISTNTKNLQDQLFYKDIPMVHDVLGIDFRAVLLKGRSNYICPPKWEHAMYMDDGRLSEAEKQAALPIILWLQQTKTGDINENHGFNVSRNWGLWTKLCSDSSYCPARDECHTTDSRCWITKIRRAAQEAHLVVINHSLLFSDLATEHGILGKYHYIIFDEAHNLEKVATDYLGYECNQWEIRTLLHQLYVKDRSDFGLLVDVRRALSKSMIRRGLLRQLSEKNENLIKDVERLEVTSNEFFRTLSHFMSRIASKDDYPIKKLRYAAGHALLDNISENFMTLTDYLEELKEDILSLVDLFENISIKDMPGVDDLRDQLSGKASELDALKFALNVLIRADDPQYVYWVEMPKKADSTDTRLLAAPIDISKSINDLLYDKMFSIIMTSATLQVNNNFDFMLERFGLKEGEQAERVKTHNIGSPFNFEEQVNVFTLSYLPTPKKGQEFTAAVTDFIKRVTRFAKRGAMVLFTSYSMLNQVYEGIKEDLEENNILVLGQGIDGNPTQILTEFKQVNESILLGTDSFWEGVDLPGDSLQFLYIPKLPFAMPSEPIIQARTEAIEKQGRNSFMEYSVPLAVIRFRQGFGRLIRTQDDVGLVFIMDNRVLQTRYGRIFLNSLPVRHREFRSARDIGNEIMKWLTRN